MLIRREQKGAVVVHTSARRSTSVMLPVDTKLMWLLKKKEEEKNIVKPFFLQGS